MSGEFCGFTTRVWLVVSFVVALSFGEAFAQNAIVVENSLPGNPQSEWDLSGPGSTNIVGFTTDISVNHGSTVNFKINTNSTNYRIDIYRLGYYGGMGGRKVATINQQLQSAQVQPSPLYDATTGLTDAGNWAISASWAVPATAVSGVYLAKLTRQDSTAGQNQIAFIVRADESHSDIVFQTSDTTWQAYNGWGGSPNLYGGNGPGSNTYPGRAFKVSYNRPITTRDGVGTFSSWASFLFGAEYAALYWLEQNGYDVSYIAGVDSARSGALLQNHKAFTSSGHDEYWSTDQRTNVEAARNAGVNVAFMSGNEVFWATRWESSIDGSATPFRTLVCYKETVAGAKIDPSRLWTGTWFDPRFSPPSNGGQPQNALSGTLFAVNGFYYGAIQVPSAMSGLRFWRNTSVASTPPGQTATLTQNILGYEWDASPDNGFAPGGLIDLSSTTLFVNSLLLYDYGYTYGNGTATHNLSLYKPSSGAIVFGAGTVFWPWGLSAKHDGPTTPTDPNIQQAMVNQFADMGVQPGSLQSGLVPATKSTDIVAPTSSISAPAGGANFLEGQPVTISGSASDTGGMVAGVEVSIDGGATWRRASGATNWSYTWSAASAGVYTIMSRATDDSLNTETPHPGPTINVSPTAISGPSSSLFSASTSPSILTVNDPNSVELGVKFYATSSGYITGVRFYKGPQNTGTHTGELWSATGTLLASATFANETASGWQAVSFARPVAIAAGMTYVASYHTSGFYSADRSYFAATYSNGPLAAPAANGSNNGNGVYAYGSAAAFPVNSYQASNYWVDVIYYSSATGGATLFSASNVPTILTVNDPNSVEVGVKFSAASAGNITGLRFYKGPQNTGTHTGELWSATGTLLGSATFANETASGWQTLSFATPVAIAAGTTYVASYHTSGFYSVDRNYFASAYSNGPLTALASGSSGGNGVYAYGSGVTFPTKSYQAGNYWVDAVFSSSLFSGNGSTPMAFAPVTVTVNDANPVELGVKFSAASAGHITGLRFYEGPLNTGPHSGELWDASGTLLASAPFTNETAYGWQTVIFDSPIAIAAGTTYVASYHTSGFYSKDLNYFTTAYSNGPLTAPDSGSSGGNGVYAYGSAVTFPTNSSQAGNYWVDVMFTTP
ncbi:MAG: DUF4082 domain-containing protein [Methylocystis sp.]|uniref:DUF4082 domain-containing protein n=1 Tax=Methylocystis sp. TaxID=1911079 RepID=UPI003DA26462